MEEVVSKLQRMLEVEQQNGGPQKTPPLGRKLKPCQYGKQITGDVPSHQGMIMILSPDHSRSR